jgi:fructosamine-3-kinase
VRRGFDGLFESLPELLKTNDPPSRLHGDLWSGNYCYTQGGAALFDPAAYVGHREVDLAMMRLFGGFEERVFEAYEAAYPLSSGSERRMKVYQLYPLLVHVNLFGASYATAVEQSLRSLTAR